MMNLVPKTRLCGICYFPLPVDARALDEPAVYRKRQPIWPPEEWVKGSPDDITKMSNEVDVLHIKTTRILVQTSSKRGCPGCTAILECLANHIQHERISMDQDCLQDECKILWAFGSSSDRRHSLVIRFTAAGREIKQVGMVLGYVGHIFQPLLSIHPAARKLRHDIVEGYTGSAASLKHLSQTLKECVSSHAHCRPSASALPYRVLELSTDIRSRISIRLVQGSNSKSHQYICLSHRWGPSTQHFRTMKSTLSLHLKSIQMADLPKTFQDAVKVTLFLGIKYLWIDSLCIIQDDDDDWKSQAAEMCNIYHGAYATLAATTSHDSTDGLFRTMQQKIAIPTHHSTYQKHFIFPDYSFLPGLSDHDYNGDFPLLGRGWVFQERILSRRFVQFAQEISVECAGHHFTHKDWKGSSNKAFHLHALESTDPIGILSHWHFLVGVFTGLNLTYQSDTLPALAGVARQYGKSHADVLGRYTAGMWENTLLEGLLWRVSWTSQRCKTAR